MIPDALARPPWVPLVAKPPLVLDVPPPIATALAWTSEAERRAWADPWPAVRPEQDAYAALDPDARDQEIGRLIAQRGIVPIYAARHLSLTAIRGALATAEPRFVEHYRLVDVALGRFGLAIVDDLLALAPRMPFDVGRALLKVDGSAIAAHFADKHLDHAAAWYLAFPRTASRALVPVALTGTAKDKTRALAAIRRLLAEGHASVVFAEADALHPRARADLEGLLAPPPLPPKAPKLPSFVDLPTLPAPTLRDGGPLDREHVERLVQLLACFPLDAARRVIVGLKDALDRGSVERTCQSLVERWEAAGAPSSDKWVLLGAAVLGHDLTADDLADRLIAWSEAGKHPRAAAALEALAASESTVALLRLSHLAGRAKSKTVRNKAAAALEEARLARGLTPDELEEHLVPDLGFDAQGKLALSYGARRFDVVLDEQLKPVLHEGGKPLRSLPKPKPTDDADLAARASASWAVLKKTTAPVIDAQGRRLERSMARRRRWSRRDFDTFYLRHPLLQQLARRLVWGTFGPDGALTGTFRIAEDGSFASVDDEPQTIEGDVFGLPHPIDLGPELARRWGALFGDYQIVSPFPQLARDIHALTPAENEGDVVTRFVGAKAPGGKFFGLKHRGWDFGDYEPGKALPNGAHVWLHTEPGLGFLAQKPEDQTLGKIQLRGAARFAELHPVDVSELLRDVDLLIR